MIIIICTQAYRLVKDPTGSRIFTKNSPQSAIGGSSMPRPDINKDTIEYHMSEIDRLKKVIVFKMDHDLRKVTSIIDGEVLEQAMNFLLSCSAQSIMSSIDTCLGPTLYIVVVVSSILLLLFPLYCCCCF